MLNGIPTSFFKSNRGIRQGCPLSPYLFVPVMEFWFLTMDISIASGTLSSLRRNSKLVVSHLLFADDVLVFSRGDKKISYGILLEKA